MKKTPFFAKFLENQSRLNSNDMKGIKGGLVSNKFPSDNDEPTQMNTNPETPDDIYI